MANGGNIDPYLGVLLRKCKEHPEMEEQHKAEYLKSYADVKKETQMSVLTTVLMHLYDYDFDSLKTDFAMLAMMDVVVVPDQKERRQCLRYLLRTLKFYARGDYSQISGFINSMTTNPPTVGTQKAQP